MPRSLIIAVAFTLLGTCWSFSQDAKTDSKNESSASFEGKEAGDRRELVPGIFFRWCPAGKFKMGEGKSVIDVELTKGFWLGETEVIQGQWKKLMGTTPWKGQNNVQDGIDYAATYVSYDDAVESAKKLTTQERKTGTFQAGWMCSLPTSAQWEYACRAGSNTRYSFGDKDSDLSEYGWWGGIKGDGSAMSERYAHEVGLKKPNAWGLRDMHGNVYEWCADWWCEKPPGGQDPVAPFETYSYRVCRGGSWNGSASYCRSAIYEGFSPESRTRSVGFRLAVVQE